MNWIVFIIESVVLCAAFHTGIYLVIKYRPEVEIYSYPPAITQRWIDLGKVPVKKVPSRAERIKKKWPLALMLGIILGAVVYFLNGCRSFISGFMVSYALWLVVDWYDALILDCIWFCHSKTCRLAGTEDLLDAYHDYAYYIRSSVLGMVIGLPICLLIGAVVQIISWIAF